MTIPEQLTELEKVHAGFKLVVGRHGTAEGSLQKGYAICETCPEGGGQQESGAVIPPTPITIVGACCLDDGSCVITTSAGCVGTWQGAGTVCDPNPCPGAGACCFEDGTCEIESEAQCSDSSGIYQGDGTVCDPNPCSLPTCCNSFPAWDDSGRRFRTKTTTTNLSQSHFAPCAGGTVPDTCGCSCSGSALFTESYDFDCVYTCSGEASSTFNDIAIYVGACCPDILGYCSAECVDPDFNVCSVTCTPTPCDPCDPGHMNCSVLGFSCGCEITGDYSCTTTITATEYRTVCSGDDLAFDFSYVLTDECAP